MTVPRRAVLAAAPGLLLAGGALAAARPAVRVKPAAPKPVVFPPGPGLDGLAMANGRFYGAAISSAILAADHPYMAAVQHECGVVTSETAFKWAELRPKPDVWDWKPADALINWALRRGLQVRGHTLLWHEDNPAWLPAELDAGHGEAVLTQHIRMAAGHCRNKVIHWDVANEVLEPKDGKPFGMRDTVWQRALGADMLPLAFHACAEADPAPLRCLNDYGMDYTWPPHQQKRQDMLALLARLRAQNVPIQGVGLQAHLEAGVNDLDQGVLARFCNDIAAMGLKIVITELDVRDNRLGGDVAARDAAVAAHARAYLDAVLSCPAVMGVLSWGLSDRRSWLNDTLPRDDKLPQRPLPLDADLQRKPLWTAIAAAFAAAPPRAG